MRLWVQVFSGFCVCVCAVMISSPLCIGKAHVAGSVLRPRCTILALAAFQPHKWGGFWSCYWPPRIYGAWVHVQFSYARQLPAFSPSSMVKLESSRNAVNSEWLWPTVPLNGNIEANAVADSQHLPLNCFITGIKTLSNATIIYILQNNPPPCWNNHCFKLTCCGLTFVSPRNLVFKSTIRDMQTHWICAALHRKGKHTAVFSLLAESKCVDKNAFY